MTREQKLEAALRRIEDLALDDMLDLVGDIAREAIELPPDNNTRVVTVDQLNTLMDRAAYAERFHNSDIAGSIADEIRTIIGGVKP